MAAHNLYICSGIKVKYILAYGLLVKIILYNDFITKPGFKNPGLLCNTPSRVTLTMMINAGYSASVGTAPPSKGLLVGNIQPLKESP